MSRKVRNRGRIGLLFGSFNPIHNGHIEIAKEAIRSGHVDYMCFVIAKQNPHKSSYGVSFDNRSDMVKSMVYSSVFTDLSLFSSSRIEEDLSGYTIDTLEYFDMVFSTASYRDKYKEFVIVCGEDVYNSVYTWKDGHKIMEKYKFLVFDRKEPIIHCNKNIIAKLPLPDSSKELSSTRIRDMIKNDIGGWEHYVPETVAMMIKEKGWYK